MERRTSRRAYAFWFQMARGRRFPSLEDLDLDAIADLKEAFFVLTAERDAADCRVLDSGPVLADALGRDPIGSRFGHVLPDSARRRMLEALQYVLDIGNPMEEQGAFSRKGKEVLYRLVFLPLADDHHTVSHVLGAFSFKLNSITGI
jgi:hypothetical protein